MRLGVGGSYGSMGMNYNYQQNNQQYMAPKQYGILATGPGSARDNLIPGTISKIARGKKLRKIVSITF